MAVFSELVELLSPQTPPHGAFVARSKLFDFLIGEVGTSLRSYYDFFDNSKDHGFEQIWSAEARVYIADNVIFNYISTHN